MGQLPYRAPHPNIQSLISQILPSGEGPVRPQWQQATWGMKSRQPTQVGGAGTGQAIVVAGVHDEPSGDVLFRAGRRTLPTGEIVADIGGELDIATADLAVGYVRDIIDRHGGPVVADVAGVRFCDVVGLGALVRMARYAEQAGCPFRLASPRPPLVKIIRIAGLEHRFRLAAQGAQPIPDLPAECAPVG